MMGVLGHSYQTDSLLRIFSSFSEYLNRPALRHPFILIDVWVMYNLGNLYRLFFLSLCTLLSSGSSCSQMCFFSPAVSDTTCGIRQMIHSPGRWAQFLIRHHWEHCPHPPLLCEILPCGTLRGCFYLCFSVESYCAAVTHRHSLVFPFKAGKHAAGDIKLPCICRHTGYIKYIRRSWQRKIWLPSPQTHSYYF